MVKSRWYMLSFVVPAEPAEVPQSGTSPLAASLIAELLVRRGVKRVFGLCGGHIQPLWDELAQAGVQIVDVRHECAAVYMAHAHTLLTGELGVVLVTAGPGLTNAVTGIANAAVARAPVVIVSGRPPLPQAGMGALQDIDHAAIIRSLCKRAEQVSNARHVLARLHATIEAAEGVEGAPGPAYIDFTTDLLRACIPPPYVDSRFYAASVRSQRYASEEAIDEAAALVRRGRRVVIIAGRGARGAETRMRAWLDTGGMLYLDTAESRGLVPSWHPAAVPGARGRAMSEADVVITVGRRLDFQLGYGSPAVFSPAAQFLRISATLDEVSDNRRGDVELLGDVGATLDRLLAAGAVPQRSDRGWLQSMRERHRQRAEDLRLRMTAATDGGSTGMHPYQLLAAVEELIDEQSIVVADGGDILSFARVALSANSYLDPGALGCLGVGVPFAISAALARPDHRVVAVIGDGAFGFTAMEVDTAVRFGARAVFVVANNAAWGIERTDQLESYGGRLVGVDLPGCRYDRLAEALGAYGERVEDPDDLHNALRRALDRAPAVLDVIVSSAARSPDQVNGLAVVPDLQALKLWDDAERRLLDGS